MKAAKSKGTVEFNGTFQTRINDISLRTDLSGATRDSLIAINQRLAGIGQISVRNPWMTQELADQVFNVIDRMSSFLVSPNATAFSEVISIMDNMSRILFDPQPEPPGYIAEGFTVLERLSRVEFDPQPEPPGLPQDLIPIMYQVACVLVNASTAGTPSGTIPALTALERLSGQLVDSLINKQPDRAAAKVKAMYNITFSEQYSGQ